ncbi:Importin subunit alpha [Entamoeba marina]
MTFLLRDNTLATESLRRNLAISQLRTSRRNKLLTENRCITVNNSTPIMVDQTINSIIQGNYHSLNQLPNLLEGNEANKLIAMNNNVINCLIKNCLASKDENIIIIALKSLNSFISTNGNGQFIKHIVACNILTHITNLLLSNNVIIVTKCFEILSKISSVECYLSNILSIDLPHRVTNLVESCSNNELTKCVCKLFSNILQVSPLKQFNTQPYIVFIYNILQKCKDENIIKECLYGLALSSEYKENSIILSNEQIQNIFIYHLNNSKSNKIIGIALKYFGNVLTFNENIVRSVVEKGILDSFEKILNCDTFPNIERDVYWNLNIISNCQNQMVIFELLNRTFLERCVNGINNESIHYKIRKEMMWLIVNILYRGEPQILSFILSKSIMIIETLMQIVCDTNVEQRLISFGLRSIVNVMGYCSKKGIDVISYFEQMNLKDICDTFIYGNYIRSVKEIAININAYYFNCDNDVSMY